uniref:Transmembrane protein 268 n=1 Tax=Varanus komodoensis TaxID=61221 RepID=A0A8D2LR77_VARKO
MEENYNRKSWACTQLDGTFYHTWWTWDKIKRFWKSIHGGHTKTFKITFPKNMRVWFMVGKRTFLVWPLRRGWDGLAADMLCSSRPASALSFQVLYVTLWLNLYSTLITFAAGKPWVVSIVVTLVSLVAALTIRLITLRYQSKVRRGWIYTALDFQSVLWDSTTGEWGLTLFFQFLQLWFVHFDVGPCLHSLTDAVAEMKRNQEVSDLKNLAKILKLYLEFEWIGIGKQTGLHGLEALNECSCLDFFQAMAEQLLTIYSGYYIRLLVSGQLPSIATGRHIALGRAPCLCQFVEKVVLGNCCCSHPPGSAEASESRV